MSTGSDVLLSIDEAVKYNAAGYYIEYRNDPQFKGLPNYWTKVPEGHKFDGAGYQYRRQEVLDTKPPELNSQLDIQVGGSHYKDMPIQPIEYIHANQLGFLEGNAIKYITRWKSKGGVQDLEKAAHYIKMLIELEGKRKSIEVDRAMSADLQEFVGRNCE